MRRDAVSLLGQGVYAQKCCYWVASALLWLRT